MKKRMMMMKIRKMNRMKNRSYNFPMMRTLILMKSWNCLLSKKILHYCYGFRSLLRYLHCFVMVLNIQVRRRTLRVWLLMSCCYTGFLADLMCRRCF